MFTNWMYMKKDWLTKGHRSWKELVTLVTPEDVWKFWLWMVLFHFNTSVIPNRNSATCFKLITSNFNLWACLGASAKCYGKDDDKPMNPLGWYPFPIVKQLCEHVFFLLYSNRAVPTWFRWNPPSKKGSQSVVEKPQKKHAVSTLAKALREKLTGEKGGEVGSM